MARRDGSWCDCGRLERCKHGGGLPKPEGQRNARALRDTADWCRRDGLRITPGALRRARRRTGEAQRAAWSLRCPTGSPLSAHQVARTSIWLSASLRHSIVTPHMPRCDVADWLPQETPLQNIVAHQNTESVSISFTITFPIITRMKFGMTLRHVVSTRWSLVTSWSVWRKRMDHVKEEQNNIYYITVRQLERATWNNEIGLVSYFVFIFWYISRPWLIGEQCFGPCRRSCMDCAYSKCVSWMLSVFLAFSLWTLFFFRIR